jgi:hypothetical protein
VWVAPIAGGVGTRVLEFGQLIGPCSDGVLAVDSTASNGTLITPAPVVKIVGGSPTDVASLPESFVEGTPEPGEVGPYLTYSGSASKGLTVIVVCIENSGPVDSDVAQIWRSIDGGATFEKVHEWPTDISGKHGSIQIAYFGLGSGIWWVGPGAEDLFQTGIWRSSNNGATWGLVLFPESVGIFADIQEMTSAGRAAPSMS